MPPPTGSTGRPLRPRLFDLNALGEEVSSLPWVMPDILSNPHCRYRIWRLHEPMSFLVRNADGDELLFIHEGSGEFYCDYGHLTLRDGDYLVIPAAPCGASSRRRPCSS